jgi:hypothetical protein
MEAALNLCSASNLMAIAAEPLKLDIRNLVWTYKRSYKFRTDI